MAVTFSRSIKKGDSGNDVKYIKDLLFDTAYLTVKPTHNIFGSDTEKAVKAFQTKNVDGAGKKLTVDGIVGKLTWAAIELKAKTTSINNNPDTTTYILSTKDYPHLSLSTIKAISNDLKNVSEKRLHIVKFILNYMYDQTMGGNDPIALYVYGANLLDTNLKVQTATESFINSKVKANPAYFDGGRKEWMIAQAKKKVGIACGDCSGAIVGYLRKFKYVSNTFDTTANNFNGNSYSSAITKANLLPGDWVGFSGHIGTYVGGGLVAEFAGGAYGAQLTQLDNRVLRNMMTGKSGKATAWNKYRRPKYYS